MTKETKIGLLVGLAFIILFAIILSEKGTTHRENKVPVFTIADAEKSIAPASGSERPLGDAGHLPVEATLSPIIQATQPPTLTQSAPIFETPTAADTTDSSIVTGPPSPTDDDTTTVLPESLVKNLNLPPMDVKTTEQTESIANATKTQAQEPVVSTAEQIKPSNTGTLTANTAPTGSGTLTDTTRIGDSITIKTVHTVQPGESLGKIAARYYGRSTPARVEAIFDSNRDVLKTAHAVKAAQKLKIPDLGAHSDAFEPANDFLLAKSTTGNTPTKVASKTPRSGQVRIPVALEDRTRSKKQASPAAILSTRLASETTDRNGEKSGATAFQWYQIRRSDTLSRIAKRELGSERRLNDILRMNKDVISNKNTLKPGMKIRLPIRTSGATEPEAAVTSISPDNAEP